MRVRVNDNMSFLTRNKTKKISPINVKPKEEKKDDDVLPPVEQNIKSRPTGPVYSEDYLMLGNIAEHDAINKTISQDLDSEPEKLPGKLIREKVIFGRAQKTWKGLGRAPSQREMRMIRLGLLINGLLCCILLLLTLLVVSGRVATGGCNSCFTKEGNKFVHFEFISSLQKNNMPFL